MESLEIFLKKLFLFISSDLYHKKMLLQSLNILTNGNFESIAYNQRPTASIICHESTIVLFVGIIDQMGKSSSFNQGSRCHILYGPSEEMSGVPIQLSEDTL